MVFSGPLDSPHGLPIVVALKQQAYGGVHVHMSGFQWVSHEKRRRLLPALLLERERKMKISYHSSLSYTITYTH